MTGVGCLETGLERPPPPQTSPYPQPLSSAEIRLTRGKRIPMAYRTLSPQLEKGFGVPMRLHALSLVHLLCALSTPHHDSRSWLSDGIFAGVTQFCQWLVGNRRQWAVKRHPTAVGGASVNGPTRSPRFGALGLPS